MLQNILAKRKAWQSEGVQLLKVRDGVIIQSADHEEWEDQNEDFAEELDNLNQGPAQNNQVVETEEEDVRPFELTIMSEGKSSMVSRLKRGSMPIELKALYGIGIAFFLLSLISVVVEIIVFFQRDTQFSNAIAYYSNSIKQSETINFMLAEIFQVSTTNSSLNISKKKTELESIITTIRSLKNSMSSSRDYITEVDSFSPVFTLGNLDSRTYRISEILEQIMSRIINLKESLKLSNYADSFKMASEDFFFIVMNSMDKLLPKLDSVQNKMYNNMDDMSGFDLWTLSIVLSILAIVVIAIVVEMVFLKKAMKLRQTLMTPYLMIPENMIKLYHSQNEYFVLLFSGMEDKHVDDLKTEVNALSKTSEQSAKNMSKYGKKKKRFSQRSMIQPRNNLLVVSLVFCVVAYCIIILILTSNKASNLSQSVPFSRLVKQRSLIYLSTLNKFYLSSFDRNVQIQGKLASSLFSQGVIDIFSTDTQISTVGFGKREIFFYEI